MINKLDMQRREGTGLGMRLMINKLGVQRSEGTELSLINISGVCREGLRMVIIEVDDNIRLMMSTCADREAKVQN